MGFSKEILIYFVNIGKFSWYLFEKVLGIVAIAPENHCFELLHRFFQRLYQELVLENPDFL